MSEILAPVYYAMPSNKKPYVRCSPEALVQSEKDALAELDIFLDRSRQAYEDVGLPQRAESVDDFKSNVFFVDTHMFNQAIDRFSDELIGDIAQGKKPVIIHASASDEFGYHVGSSEYIALKIFENMQRIDPDLRKHVSFEPLSHLKERPIAKNEDLYFFDDWVISGGQLTKLLHEAGPLAKDINMRFVALRENWDTLISTPFPSPENIENVHTAAPIVNLAAGPSLIGSHSTVNIGWQNRIANFGIDLAYLEDREIPLPALGNLQSQYRSPNGKPYYYRKPPEMDLLAWRELSGFDPDGFTQLSINALTNHFRHNEPGSSNNQPSV